MYTNIYQYMFSISSVPVEDPYEYSIGELLQLTFPFLLQHLLKFGQSSLQMLEGVAGISVRVHPVTLPTLPSVMECLQSQLHCDGH